ncbi:MAG TPA: hypothetical protein VHO03_13545 [Ignavibacteriales bacterium]|nr:hypothetical protein [Ignavibacteriales bacterium]
MKKLSVILLVIVLVISLAITALYFLVKGKEISYRKLTLHQKNPTSYVFNYDVKRMWDTIKSVQNDFDRELDNTRPISLTLHYIGTDLFTVDSVIFVKPENRHDFVLFSFHEEYKLYSSAEGRVSYSATFHIHLDSLERNKTRVTIFTLYSTIFVDVNSIIQHAPGAYNYYPVEPTTIEEYQILRAIGKKMGIIQTMPELILPDRGKNITAKEKHS